MRVMGDHPFLKKMGPYKRLEYDSTGILYGFSVRVFFNLTPKSEHSAQSSKTQEKTHFLKSKKHKKWELWPAGGNAPALAQDLDAPAGDGVRSSSPLCVTRLHLRNKTNLCNKTPLCNKTNL